MKSGPRFYPSERAKINAGAKALWAEGRTMVEIAEYYGVSTSYIREILKAAQRPNPPGKQIVVNEAGEILKRHARSMFAAGHSVVRIANVLNVSTTTVYEWCEELQSAAA